MNKFSRLLDTLKLLPLHPRKIDTTRLRADLQAKGCTVDVRTIQRDLEALAQDFPLYCDERSKPYGWSLISRQVIDLPSMDPTTALTLVLASEHLKPLLPVSVWGSLTPYFKHAENTLDDVAPIAINQWHHKVRVLPKGLPLLAPEISEDVHDVISQSLMAGRKFRAIYQPANREPVEYEVNPLAIAVRGNVSYLVATLADSGNLKQLALHRFLSAAALAAAATSPPGFDLDDYIRNGEFDYPLAQNTLALDILVKSDAAYHLSETRLSSDQKIEKTSDGLIRISATVADTLELRRWLMSFGDQLEVIGPLSLRREMRDIAIGIHAIYND